MAVTPHGSWQPNLPGGSDAVWVSYADTGIEGELAPINQTGPLMTIRLRLASVAETNINFNVWADDTAAVWFNGVQVKAPNLTQSTCANGPIGCEVGEGLGFNWQATGNDVIRIDTYQVGTDTNPASNPFGVLYYGSYEPDLDRSNDVPEPTSLALLGIGLLGAGLASNRRKKN